MNGTPATPWLTAAEAAAYLRRGRRFVLREIRPVVCVLRELAAVGKS